MTHTVDPSTFNILNSIVDGYDNAVQILQYPRDAEYRASNILAKIMDEILEEAGEPPQNRDEWHDAMTATINRLIEMLDGNEILVIG
jgi:hypothetical protein